MVNKNLSKSKNFARLQKSGIYLYESRRPADVITIESVFYVK